MSLHFHISLEKCPKAVHKALSILKESRPCGETRSLAFHLGPPSRGKLPFQIDEDGRLALVCELSDVFPSFLEETREWMERCLVRDQQGTLHPEILTLDCVGMVMTFVMFHVGWDKGGHQAAVPISYFLVVRSDHKDPVICCFCNTLDTLSSLYDAFIDCLCRYRYLFDNPAFWYDVKRLDKMDAQSTTDRLLGQIRSSKIETLFRKRNHFLVR